MLWNSILWKNSCNCIQLVQRQIQRVACSRSFETVESPKLGAVPAAIHAPCNAGWTDSWRQQCLCLQQQLLMKRLRGNKMLRNVPSSIPYLPPTQSGLAQFPEVFFFWKKHFHEKALEWIIAKCTWLILLFSHQVGVWVHLLHSRGQESKSGISSEWLAIGRKGSR